MATYTPKAGLGKPTAGQTGWGTVINRTIDLLDAEAAVGGFAVRPSAIDASTGQATGRDFTVGSGYLIEANGQPAKRTFLGTNTAPASATTYVWIDEAEDLGYAAALPTDAGYLPLAKLTTDATRITAIEDLRFAQPVIGGTGGDMWRLLSANQAGNLTIQATTQQTLFSVDATGGNRSVTLPPLSGVGDKGQVVIISKGDVSANTVTVAPAGSDAGPTVVLSAQYEAAFLVVGGGATKWLKLKLV